MNDERNIDEIANDLDSFLKENPDSDGYEILNVMDKEGFSNVVEADEFIKRGYEHSFTEKMRKILISPKTNEPTSDLNRSNLAERIREKLNHDFEE